MATLKLKIIAQSEFDPRKPDDINKLLDNKPANFLKLFQWCNLEDVCTPDGLIEAPRELRALIKDVRMRPDVLKLLLWLKTTKKRDSNPTIRIYADTDELEAMNKCHLRSLEVLRGLLGRITPRSFIRALDVGGGDGRLARSFLIDSYNKVDLFDQCPIAVKKAKEALQGK